MGPSWRQTKLVIRCIGDFARRSFLCRQLERHSLWLLQTPTAEFTCKGISRNYPKQSKKSDIVSFMSDKTALFLFSLKQFEHFWKRRYIFINWIKMRHNQKAPTNVWAHAYNIFFFVSSHALLKTPQLTWFSDSLASPLPCLDFWKKFWHCQ